MKKIRFGRTLPILLLSLGLLISSCEMANPSDTGTTESTKIEQPISPLDYAVEAELSAWLDSTGFVAGLTQNDFLNMNGYDGKTLKDSVDFHKYGGGCSGIAVKDDDLVEIEGELYAKGIKLAIKNDYQVSEDEKTATYQNRIVMMELTDGFSLPFDIEMSDDAKTVLEKLGKDGRCAWSDPLNHFIPDEEGGNVMTLLNGSEGSISSFLQLEKLSDSYILTYEETAEEADANKTVVRVFELILSDEIRMVGIEVYETSNIG
ncbi:MAG: hypothetical protein IJY37_05555 [Clostridia bacterium]|nr:hypothetical protein [Clostridia bacterium]